MRLPGDQDADHAEKLADAAVAVLRGIAAGDGYSQVREARLRDVMSLAYTFAESMEGLDPDPARRRGAAAAVMLIQNSNSIFLDFPSLPVTAGDVYRSDYRVAAAWMLAETFAERTGGSEARRPTVNLVAQGGLVSTVKQIIVEHDKIVAEHGDANNRIPTQLGSWPHTSFAKLVDALAAYHGTSLEWSEQRRLELEALLQEDGSERDSIESPEEPPDEDNEAEDSDSDKAHPREALNDPEAIVTVPLQKIENPPATAETGRADSGDPSPLPLAAPPPVNRPESPRQPRGKVVAAATGAGLALVATTAAITLLGVSLAIPEVPQRLFGSSTSTPSTPAASSADEVITSRVLPNTKVELLLMDGETSNDAEKTAAGALPTASPRLVPNLYDTQSFKIVISALNPEDSGVDQRDLQVSIAATSPMIVKDAKQLAGASFPDWPASALNNQRLAGVAGNSTVAGKAIIIPHPKDGAPAIFTFDVEAHPDDTSNGYMCGFNAKSVQVMVRQVVADPKQDDGLYATTPYPLYVGRWKGC